MGGRTPQCPLRGLNLSRSQGWDGESLIRRSLGSSVLWEGLPGGGTWRRETGQRGWQGTLEMVGRKNGLPREREGVPQPTAGDRR